MTTDFLPQSLIGHQGHRIITHPLGDGFFSVGSVSLWPFSLLLGIGQQALIQFRKTGSADPVDNKSPE